MATNIFLVLAVLALMAHVSAPALAQTPAPNPPATSAPAQTLPAPAAPVAKSPMSAQESAQAVAGAKALMIQVLHSNKNTFPSPSLFTNRSAALVGVIMLIPLALIEAFSSMGEKKGKTDKAAQDIDALSKKYNMNPPTNGSKAAQNAAIAGFESHGRQFYSDVIVTFNKVLKDSQGKTKSSSNPDASPSSQFPQNIAAYTFTPISPTTVKITTNKPGTPPMEAKLENGLWRLDLGGLADLNKWMPATKAGNSTASQSGNGEAAYSSDNAPTMKEPETLFFPRASGDEAIDNGTTVEFSDDYQWTIADKIFVQRDGTTDNGRKIEAWLGKKADYFHILHTNLVAIRLHNASYPHQDTFGEAIMGGDTDRVEELIAANPKIVNTQVDMDTPLQRAVFYDNKEILQLLLRHGANVNAANDFGQTPLMDAAQFDKTDMAKLLLAAGAKVNQKNDQGQTALSIAKSAHNASMVALLKQHGAR